MSLNPAFPLTPLPFQQPLSMCNMYTVDVNHHELADWANAPVQLGFTWHSGSVYPRSHGPGVLLNEEGNRELVSMRFGLTPVGSKSLDHHRPLYNNARVESLDKWPWKPSANLRCIVPLTRFKEPCYWGPLAGHQVDFFPTEGSILGVACLFHQLENEYTMTFLMRPACEFVMEHGHQRQPFFIHKDGFGEWLGSEKRSIEETKNVLARYAWEPQLDFEDLGEMKSGWKSRVSAAVKKRDAELQAIKGSSPLGF